MDELKLLLQHLKQPEYVHVLLNPLPVYGMGMGVIALLAALFTRSRGAKIIGLGLVFLAGVSAWPVIHYGQAGYDRVYAMSNGDAKQWLDLHMERAERWEYVFYVTALLAAVSTAALWKFPKATSPLLAATLMAAIACIVVGAWIGHAGGQVRHSEFRNGPPPAPEHGAHPHEH
jgi:hypothetical protein